jgi:hypothetical protein
VSESIGEHDIAWYAGILDRVAATAETDFALALNVRHELGIGFRAALPDDASHELKAAVWAFTYVIDFAGKQARLVPRDNYGERSDPPRIKDVPENIRQLWRQLLEQVHEPAAKARLAHLVFQCGGTGGREAGLMAVDGYVESTAKWRHRSDSIEDLCAATRIARTIGDEAGAGRVLDRLLDLADAALNAAPAPAGIILRAFTHAIGEPLCPDRIDALLERAASELPDVKNRDQALELMQARCGDDPCRSALWERRVDVYIDAAALATDSAIMQMVLRQDALRTAEASGRRDLYERAAAALQDTRDIHAELIRFESSSALYEEEFASVRDSLIRGDSWKQALVTFATAGPLSGDYDANVENTKKRRQLAPLTALMPVTLLGPDGLPIYQPTTEEDRFDYDLTQFEVHIIGGMLRPLISALHVIPERFGLPLSQDIAIFLDSWPGMSRAALPTITVALQRFWVGDSHGAIYTLMPTVETLVRDLILNVNHGMYRLQQTHAPGQYPGLGVMLDLLPDFYVVSPGWLRALKTILTHPAGFNLRNRLSHGVERYSDPGHAALAIHTALWLTTLTPKAPVDVIPEEEPEAASGMDHS